MLVNKISTEQKELKIKAIRFMTTEEFDKYVDQLPKTDGSCWWLEEKTSTRAYYAEGEYRESDMVCSKGEANTFIRPILEIEGLEDAGLAIGEKFAYCGVVFVVLDESLAISENFVGFGKFFDKKIAEYCWDENITNTALILVQNIIKI
jgi:hypothetical protein